MSKCIKWLVLAAIIIMHGPVFALELKASYPKIYTVQANDSLWSIAAKYLKNPWHWSRLWQCNPQIHNPHLIYPGDTLRVQHIGGNTCLQLETRVVKLSPKMRIDKSQSPIPPIPMKLIEPFLTKSRVMSLKQFLAAPYVLAHGGNHLISTQGNTIYVRGLRNRNVVRYAVLHREETYLDPITKKSLGIEARYVAAAELVKYADPASLRVIAVRGVINNGDRLFPVETNKKLTEFIPHSPSKMVHASIIAVLRSISQVGRFNIVALNYGKRSGAKPGQVLTILRSGKFVNDKYSHNGKQAVLLPSKKIGVLMIFKTFPQVSYALIMQANQAVRILDKVETAR